MKKIYIAGCGGMLGEAFHKQFGIDHELRCSDIDVNAPWLSYTDIREYTEYRKSVRAFNPDWLFHLGALTDLEYCEQYEAETYLTNTIGVENAVKIANELDIPLLYISTAGIFDGEKGVYDDWDHPNPLGIYGRAKYMGERYVVENSNRYLICRAGWMMGGGPGKDKKFIQKIMAQLKEGKRELAIVNDKGGTPTYTHDFARTVKYLMTQEFWGIYNCVCHGTTSRLQVAQELLKILGMEDKVKITEVSSYYFKKDYFAPRPDSERLLNCKLKLRHADLMQDWRGALRAYIKDYWQGYLD
jgi:dTDP-4-dehydrorhamnose reductase